MIKNNYIYNVIKLHWLFIANNNIWYNLWYTNTFLCVERVRARNATQYYTAVNLIFKFLETVAILVDKNVVALVSS